MGWRQDVNRLGILIQLARIGLAILLLGLAGLFGAWGDSRGTQATSGAVAGLGLALMLLALFRRVNLEILGNTDPFLHAHVWPRYEWEPPALGRKPVWLYPAANWSDPGTALGPEHDPLRAAITRHLFGDA